MSSAAEPAGGAVVHKPGGPRTPSGKDAKSLDAQTPPLFVGVPDDAADLSAPSFAEGQGKTELDEVPLACAQFSKFLVGHWRLTQDTFREPQPDDADDDSSESVEGELVEEEEEGEVVPVAADMKGLVLPPKRKKRDRLRKEVQRRVDFPCFLSSLAPVVDDDKKHKQRCDSPARHSDGKPRWKSVLNSEAPLYRCADDPSEDGESTFVTCCGQYLEVPFRECLNPQSFTVMCFVRLRVARNNNCFRCVVCSRDPDQHTGYMIYIGAGGHWEARVGTGDKWVTIKGPHEVVPDKWYHLALSHDALEGQTFMFIDGSSLEETKCNFVPNKTSPILIGAGTVEEPRPSYFLNGDVCDVRVYRAVQPFGSRDSVVEVRKLEFEAYQCRNRGKASYARDDWDPGIVAFTNAIHKLRSGNSSVRNLANALHWRAACYREKDKYSLAIADASQAIELRPRNPSYLHSRGVILSGMKNYDEAIEDFSTALRLNSTHWAAFHSFRDRGYCHQQKGEHDAAIADATEAIQFCPYDADLLHRRSLSHRAKGDFNSAIADITKAIHLDSRNAELWDSRGRDYHVKGVYRMAIADKSEAVHLKPDDPSLLTSRAKTYFAKGEHDLAIADFSEAIRLKSDDASLLRWRGESYQEKREYDLAIADYSRALELRPDDAAVFDSRGRCHCWKQDYDAAIADGTEAIRLNPDDPDLLRSRGESFYANGDCEKAIADETKAIQMRSDDADLFNLRAWRYYTDCNYEKAIADFSEAIRLDPTVPQHLKDRAVCYQEQGSYDLAIKDGTAAIRLEPSGSGAWLSRGISFYYKGDVDSAICDYAEAIRLDPKSVSARADRAIALLRKRDTDEASADYIEAAQIGLGDDPFLYRDRASLHVAMKAYSLAYGDLSKAIVFQDLAFRSVNAARGQR